MIYLRGYEKAVMSSIPAVLQGVKDVSDRISTIGTIFKESMKTLRDFFFPSQTPKTSPNCGTRERGGTPCLGKDQEPAVRKTFSGDPRYNCYPNGPEPQGNRMDVVDADDWGILKN